MSDRTTRRETLKALALGAGGLLAARGAGAFTAAAGAPAAGVPALPAATAPLAIRSFLSARDSGARLSAQRTRAIAAADPDLPSVWVDSSRRFQTLLGFGGAFTEAAAVTWLKLSAERREDVLRAYFSMPTGHGYAMCRVHMNSCDFALGNYAQVETAGDTSPQELQHRARPAGADSLHQGCPARSQAPDQDCWPRRGARPAG